MAELLPRVLYQAVHHRGIDAASLTYGLIPLVAGLLLLFAYDAGDGHGVTARRRLLLTLAVPLMIASITTDLARIALLIS